MIDDIPTFDGKPELYFDWILKLENIAVVTKHNPKELALGKAQGAIIKCLNLLSADASWNGMKAILRQKMFFSSKCNSCHHPIMHRYQQKGQSLQVFIFEFSELIQTITNCDPTDITDLLKIYMYVQKI